MQSRTRSLSFPPFRFDPADERLWRDSQAIFLRRKTLAVLRSLVEHPGQLVTKEELFAAAWPHIVVTEGLLTKCISELREALGDDPKAPEFVETVHGRGYRWIAPLAPAPLVASSQYPVASRKPAENAPLQLATGNWQLTTALVGRETELAQLHDWLAKAQNGERQAVFVTGEPGIGKTTLVDAFVAQIGAGEEHKADTQTRRYADAEIEGRSPRPPFTASPRPNAPAPAHPFIPSSPLIARGQCIEHYGPGEAYLPMLEALGRLCREPDGTDLIGLLSRYAPTWLVQMPTLLEDAELEAIQRRVQGANQERMLREMAEALEVLTSQTPLVLVLEDLHWSDVSTLDLLAFLARRREKARLLVIGTYRPAEALPPEHPLRAVTQELHLHHYCRELRLGFLTAAEIVEYVSRRFTVGTTHASPLHELAHVIYQRTEGNPLFMVNVVDFLLVQGIIFQDEEHWTVRGEATEVVVGVPDNIRQMIERQIERLSPEEQQVLEAASVAGGEFAAATVAAGLEATVGEVEERCTGLVRRAHLLRAQGISEWPDGTVTTRYQFAHALYQAVLYERVMSAQRIRFHRRIGERLETAYGDQAREVAAELAMHFERGRDSTHAVRYLEQAGENASRRSAYVEASNYLSRGLELLAMLPDTPERLQQEFTLQIALGGALMATQGYGALAVERVYSRARELCRQMGDTPQLFPALRGLWVFALVRAEHRTAQELGEQLLRLAQQGHDPALLLEAHQALGMPLGMLGEFAAAQAHLEQGIGLHDLSPHHTPAFLYAHDPGVACLVITAWTLWFRGYPDQALARAEDTLALARKLSHPFNLGLALVCSAVVLRQCHRQGQAMQRWADEAVALLTEQGFPYWLALATMLQGADAVSREQSEAGITQLKQGLAAFRSTEAACLLPYFLALLAEAYGERGQAEQGLAIVEEALATVEKTGERFYEAELWRLKGQLALQCKVQNVKCKILNPQAEAEECFQRAIDIARQQGAKSLELRAVMSLSRLWQQQGKQKKARKLLAEIYGWFTEGFETADLQEARELLEELQL